MWRNLRYGGILDSGKIQQSGGEISDLVKFAPRKGGARSLEKWVGFIRAILLYGGITPQTVWGDNLSNGGITSQTDQKLGGGSAQQGGVLFIKALCEASGPNPQN